MMKFIIPIFIILTLCSPSIGIHAQFINGDFQSNPIYGCTAGPNWSFDTDVTNLPELTDIFQPGNWWIDLTPCGDFGNGTWIEQTITTVPGACYSVTMDIASYCGWDGSDAGINLTANGVAVGDRIFNDEFSCIAGTLGWGTFTSDVFIATNTTTTLRFTGEGRCSAISDPTLCAPLGGVGNPGVMGLDNIVLNVLSGSITAIDEFPDQIRCPGQNLVIGAAIANATYLWNTGQTTAQISVQTAGSYSVEISTGCGIKRDTIQVTDQSLPPTFDLGPNLSFCDDFLITLDSGLPLVNWSNQAISGSITVSTPGIYSASSSNSCGTFTDQVEIIQDFIPTPSQEFEVILCENKSTILTSLGINPIWSTGDTTQFIVVNSPGTYESIVANNCGQSIYTYQVILDPCIYFFYAPNSFTPNGDGLNETWHPTLLGEFEAINISIWNRWGDEIWRSSGPEINWTGQAENGEFFAPDGIYQYIALVKTEAETTRYEGHITIIR